MNTKFALMNTRSVRNKADFINDYIVEHHLDIIALTGTWLSHDDNAEINALRAGGYNLCHLPRKNRRGGGVGVFYKSTFKIISETALTTDTFEGLRVTLQCPETRSNIRVYVLYRPPSSSLSHDFMDDLGNMLRSAATHPNESIICGDFNVHYGNTRSTGA
ncbi:MAG: endonuclease/exonuclease/phosphatase family protein, partial [Chromatiales bacterium]